MITAIMDRDSAIGNEQDETDFETERELFSICVLLDPASEAFFVRELYSNSYYRNRYITISGQQEIKIASETDIAENR